VPPIPVLPCEVCSMSKVKICGLTNAKDYRLAQSLGADYCGFIFFPDSPRAITPEQAAAIVEQCPGQNQRVGVFVNEASVTVRTVFKQVGLHIAQLHGHESPQYCRELGLPYWKVLRLQTAADLALMADFSPAVFLLDARSSSAFGGTGRRCPGQLVCRAILSGQPVVVAGGVSAENIAEILSWKPFAVDVCSALEECPGKKDPAKMKHFFKQLKIWRHDHEQ
jgi:phosphoribosylanthranilate isomerase